MHAAAPLPAPHHRHPTHPPALSGPLLPLPACRGRVLRAQALARMLVDVCKNPRNPGFNHYLFESVAALIRHGTAASSESISQ